MLTSRPPKNPDLRRVWIMASLRIIGSSYAALARELGVNRSAVMQAAKFAGKSARCEAAIAAKLGLHPSCIWPERYQSAEDSTPTRRRKQ